MPCVILKRSTLHDRVNKMVSKSKNAINILVLTALTCLGITIAVIVSVQFQAVSNASTAGVVTTATPTRTRTPTKRPATATRTRTKTSTRTSTPTRTKTPPRTSTVTNTPFPPCPTAVLPPPASVTGTIPEHAIGVRKTASGGEFYLRATGERFTLRGNNYIRLVPQRLYCGSLKNYHATFNPTVFDPAQIEQALGKMQSDGYNTVRVFINACCATDGVGDVAGGLSQAYLTNLATFLNLARAHQIYVVLTADRVPEVGGYSQLEAQGSSAQIRGQNVRYLSAKGIEAAQRFWTDLIVGLQAQGAPLDAILSYEIENESYYSGKQPPFTLSSGQLTTANGQTYDLQSFDAKLRLADENFVNWVNRVRDAILQVDPTALVTFGFFPSGRPSPTTGFPDRFLRPGAAIADPQAGGSNADWVDVHLYPGMYKLDDMLSNNGITQSMTKPVVLGEFGAFKNNYRILAYAADGLVSWQMQTCSKNFQGWLLWIWNINEQPALFSALESNEFINSVLKPVKRPDPCQPWSVLGTNLALNASVIASNSLAGKPARAVNDSAPLSYWDSGMTAPQWIEINLQKPQAIDQVRLVIRQSSPGATTHRIWGKAAGEEYRLLKEFVGTTSGSQVLDFIPTARLENIQYIRVETTQSVGTVAWYEIEVLQR